MQESRFDGGEVITPNASPSEVERALADRRNREVTLFYPGRITKLPNGQRVIRGEDSKWYIVLGESTKAPVLPREEEAGS